MLLQNAFPASSCSQDRHLLSYSGIGFVLLARDEFLLCEAEKQEEKLARTPSLLTPWCWALQTHSGMGI